MSHYEKNHFPRGQVRLMLIELAKDYPEMLDAALVMIDKEEKDNFKSIVLRLIALKPSTTLELTMLSGFSLDEVRRKLNMMHKMGEIHISAYTDEPGRRHQSKIFHVGAGVDAPYPYRLTEPRRAKPTARAKQSVLPKRTVVQPKRDVAAAWF